MLPQIQDYHKALDDSQDAFEARISDLIRKRNDGKITEGAYGVLLGEANELNGLKKQTAWNLLKHDTDPLIAWIANNMRHYQDRAEIVLDALPMTLAELRQFRFDREWCDTYDTYLEHALAAGAIAEADVSAERRQFIQWLRTCGHLSSTKLVECNEQLDALIAAEREDAVRIVTEEQALAAQATDAENAAHEPDDED
jgi:hypothetical protein